MRSRNRTIDEDHQQGQRPPIAALACGVLGAASGVMLYWLIVPGLLLGAAAIFLGWRERRANDAARGNIAITLGIVAILLVPATHAIADTAEQWGRDCALDPAMDPNC